MCPRTVYHWSTVSPRASLFAMFLRGERKIMIYDTEAYTLSIFLHQLKANRHSPDLHVRSKEECFHHVTNGKDTMRKKYGGTG